MEKTLHAIEKMSKAILERPELMHDAEAAD